ncbi:hypothetical protein N1028_02135 [Herbiconiux sp. CPCC 203407]|uniref:Large exoprotein n=1 Tax=Herbiconiux oxytropis TaxID=2970915 RepID=A0AA42BVN8_9MICO|nr:hypothetical protein [Herbiconiux oxytropis]MCS5721036.1 hypothetical protein [Herbiconiux oxytropis]MCS5724688.1 hypothetical protein [Herbiconiux oxytropis]
MTTDWLSGGFIIALAAVLWLAYLLPSWFRSRQYLATERNAVRLQQTLRILAETAELPQEVRVEANARAIAEQERILKHRALERELSVVPAAVRTADRLRRSRAGTSVVLLLSVAVAVLGGMQAVYTGAWIILIGGVIASGVSVAVLVKLSKAGRRLRLPRPEAPTAQVFVIHDVGEDRQGDGVSELVEAEEPVAVEEEQTDGWTPVAIPRPLYMSRAASAPLGLDDGPDEAEVLRAAAAADEAALRARLEAERATVAELPVAPVAQAPAAAPSRFARMGIVDADTEPHLDLDSVLARRRAG